MTRQPRRPTLDQVAARAGVGRGTVSRVINGSPQVSERTRGAVERAVAELGYVPNLAARALVTRRTGAIALVISESEERVFGEPFFGAIVRGISAATTAAGRQLVLISAQDDGPNSALAGYLSLQHVDGALLLSLHGDDPLPRILRDRNVPVVLGGRPVGWAGEWYVDVDNAEGARSAVAHLAAGGRRRIATVAGPQDMVVGRERLRGWRAALDDAGLTADPGLVHVGDFSQRSGAEAMTALLEQAPDLDAVFAASDLMAAGVLSALRRSGRRVPDDVAVVGFDNSELAEHTEPPLTSVDQPSEQMGRAMVDLLSAQIDSGAAEIRHVLLPTSLIVRASG